MSAKIRETVPIRSAVSRDTLAQSLSNQNFKKLKAYSKIRITSALTTKNKNKPLDTFDAISSMQYIGNDCFNHEQNDYMTIQDTDLHDKALNSKYLRDSQLSDMI
jgi:hypothetical protein